MNFKISKVKENFKEFTPANYKKYLKVVTIAIILAVLLVSGYSYAQKNIIITIDGESTPVQLFSFTVKSALEKAGIELEDGDLVEPAVDSWLSEGMNIQVKKALSVEVEADGNLAVVKMVEPTVEKVLQEAGIVLGEMDKVETNLNEEKSSLFVKVIRVTQEVKTREVPLKYTQKLIPDENMFRGERKVLQKGRNGLKEEKYRLTYEDGQKIEEEVLEERVITAPVEETILFGTKERWEPADRYKPALSEYQTVKEIELEATAYTHTGNTTYTGIWPYEGVVAVDPDVIPLGTRMYVEGYGFAEALDIGGAIKGEKIDLFMDTKEDALDWGRQKVKVYILEKLDEEK